MSSSVLSVSFCSTSGAVHPDTPLSSMDGIVTEFVFEKPVRNPTSGFVGTIGCWTAGISVGVVAVAFALAGSMTIKLIGLVLLLVAGALCGLARTAPAIWKLRLTAACLSLGLMLLLAEIVLRCVTDFPVNTASNMIPHPQLGYVLDPRLDDVDANGFRNADVLQQADIVAIGDSQTQGFNAAAEGSWPQLLAEQSSQTVYNMGVGGYGPLQYSVLIGDALKLQPKQIVVGLYLGNDLGDVARGIQERHSEREIENPFRHVIKYHTATGSALHQLLRHSKFGRPAGFEISHSTNPTFVADQRVRFLSSDMDLTDPRINTALQTTLQVLAGAKQQCSAAGATLTVMLIPTRESVYCHSQQTVRDAFPDGLLQLTQRESELRARLQSSLTELGIESRDVLPSLVSAIDSGAVVYSAHDEGHPLTAGYRVYADTVAGESSMAATNALTN